MNQPYPSRSGLLKTLSDELHKAQSDIFMINLHQTKRNRIVLPPDVHTVSLEVPNDHIHKSIAFEDEESVNIIGGGQVFYKLDCRDKNFPLRLTFKNVKGQIRFMASFKNRYPNPLQADYNFLVDKEIRRALPQKADMKNTLYICFASTLQLGMMKVYIDSYTQQMEKVSRARQGTRAKPGTKAASVDQQRHQIEQSTMLNSYGSNKLLLSPLKSERLGVPMVKQRDHLDKNMQIATKYKQVASQRIIDYRQREASRYQDNKARRNDIQRFKEKSREFKAQASESKQLIRFRKERFKEEVITKQHLIRNLSTLLEMYKFVTVLQHKKQAFVEKLKATARVTNFQTSFANKLKAKMRAYKQALPQQQHRNRANLRLSLRLVGWAVQNKNLQRVSEVTSDFLTRFSLSTKVNMILSQTTEYRRKIRHLQKFWKLKYNTRLQMICRAGASHVKAMVSQFKHLKNVEVDFEIKGTLQKVGIEYMKEATLRFNAAYLTYFKRLETLKEIAKLNDGIKQQNAKTSRKNQKPTLNVPIVPPKPYPRYFRDLDTFRSMLRAWFQLQSKKYEKKKQKQAKTEKEVKQHMGDQKDELNQKG